ncbi:MAG: alanyl-tRNA editing protein [Anaerolineales bacterium]|nr:alanyl-tRNA editing protein [Anaerolineales bacterium]
MTTRIYHSDSYQSKFIAEVTFRNEENHGVVLSQTAFFPGGGGQPGDKGTISYEIHKSPIKKIKNIDGQLIHFLTQSVPLPEVGISLTGEIDWVYRYQLMRTHTAMHILCGVVFRDYGVSVTGGNMTPLKGRMDFEFSSLDKDLVSRIEETVNIEVENSRPVTWRNVPREAAFKIPDLIRTKINLLPKHIDEIRIVEIEGLDLQADGGTHVKNTSEVGKINIADYKSKGRENKRIYLELSN